MNRREFLGGSAAALATGLVPTAFADTPREIRAVLLHAGLNMWGDWRAPGEAIDPNAKGYSEDHIRFNETLWREEIEAMRARRLNMVVVDLGEFMTFPSHPELAVKGSWSAERMKAEVERLRGLGIEAIPKLNFSTAHSFWLKEYHRMTSTRTYYQVCADVIRDAFEAFGRPRFFHIGFDEEVYPHVNRHPFMVMRQGELWWHDLDFFVKTVEKLGGRAWMFSDYGWNHPDFLTRCPKSVVQTNYYYNAHLAGYDVAKMGKHAIELELFEKLDKAGFDQIPCGTNWVSGEQKKQGWKVNEDPMREIVKYCRKNCSRERVLGYLMASWQDCFEPAFHKLNLRGIELLDEALAV